MREPLKVGSHIYPPERDVQYTILEQIGSGSSSLVYRAEFRNEHGRCEVHLLKEYFPSRFTVHRGPDGVLRLADDTQGAYQAGMNRFLAGAHNIHELRRCDELQPYICEILCVFPANGTCYLDMPLSEGIVYACVQEISLEHLLRRISALTKVVGKIHETGLLCLDLKPGNLLVKPENPEHIMLFDLDTAISRETLYRGGRLYYSHSWAPPEQKLPSLYGGICEATDLYTIGELMFYQLFGRHSKPEEHRLSATFNFQGAPLLNGVAPEILQLLERSFHNTIATSPARRHQSADELLYALDELLARNDRAQGISGDGTTIHSHLHQKAAGPAKGEKYSYLNLTYAAIDSGDYGLVRRQARHYRIQVESFYGKQCPDYLHAVFCDAAACFSELASNLDANTIPPSHLIDAFLSCLMEYLALAGEIPSEVNPHCGGLAAFADGLRQTAYLCLNLQRPQCSEQEISKIRSMLDMAMNLARYAEDAETVAELREMAGPLSQG